MRYRTKPFEIDAMQFTGENYDDLKMFVGPGLRFIRATVGDAVGNYRCEVYSSHSSKWIPFGEGDWVIKGDDGEFYPCVDDVFRRKYEQVT